MDEDNTYFKNPLKIASTALPQKDKNNIMKYHITVSLGTLTCHIRVPGFKS